MPTPSITGRPAIVTIGERDPEVPASPNAQTTPTRMTNSGSSRQRTLNSTSRITTMIATAMAPSVSIPPRR